MVELGARHIEVGQRTDEGHVVLADPEGNEFCVIEPDNSFLADCGRLGSITCDGTREVGCFWSEALGWPLVRDQDEESAIRAPDGTGPLITWGGPLLAPKIGKNMLHLNALAESVNGLYKTECTVPRGPWRDVGELELATAEWVEFYNKARLHSSLDRMTPVEFEAAYWARQSDT